MIGILLYISELVVNDDNNTLSSPPLEKHIFIFIINYLIIFHSYVKRACERRIIKTHDFMKPPKALQTSDPEQDVHDEDLKPMCRTQVKIVIIGLDNVASKGQTNPLAWSYCI